MKLLPVAALAALGLCSPTADARPIAYADATSLMVEGDGSMTMLDLQYAPSARWALGLGYVDAEPDASSGAFEYRYLRVNRLLKRWNLPRAQANLFAWASAGELDHELHSDFGHSLGLQADYETLRIYSRLRVERTDADGFEFNRGDVQFGFAPYAHRHRQWATFFVVQHKVEDGNQDHDQSSALLLRLFNHRLWIEVGADTDGEPVFHLMLNL